MYEANARGESLLTLYVPDLRRLKAKLKGSPVPVFCVCTEAITRQRVLQRRCASERLCVCARERDRECVYVCQCSDCTLQLTEQGVKRHDVGFCHAQSLQRGQLFTLPRSLPSGKPDPSVRPLQERVLSAFARLLAGLVRVALHARKHRWCPDAGVASRAPCASATPGQGSGGDKDGS